MKKEVGGVAMSLLSDGPELDETPPSSSGSCIPGRIIALYVVSACHFASVVCMLIDVSNSSNLFVMNQHEFSSFDAYLISFDFTIMILLLGWSFIQLAIAYRLDTSATLRAAVLSWVVLLVEAAFVLVFVYGLFGSAPANGNPFKAAGGIILTTIVIWQFVYTIIVTTFLGSRFERFGCGPDSCCSNHRGYESLV
jgi:hypothetical protein